MHFGGEDDDRTSVVESDDPSQNHPHMIEMAPPEHLASMSDRDIIEYLADRQAASKEKISVNPLRPHTQHEAKNMTGMPGGQRQVRTYIGAREATYKRTRLRLGTDERRRSSCSKTAVVPGQLHHDTGPLATSLFSLPGNTSDRPRIRTYTYARVLSFRPGRLRLSSFRSAHAPPSGCVFMSMHRSIV